MPVSMVRGRLWPSPTGTPGLLVLGPQVSWGPGPCQGGPRMGGRPVEGKGGPSPAGVDEASGLDGGLHGIAPVLVG